MRRLTVVVDAEIESWLEEQIVSLGATGYTSSPCQGAGRRELKTGTREAEKVRVEVVMPREICDAVLNFLRREVLPQHSVTACVETVDVVRPDHFFEGMIEDDKISQAPAKASH